MIIKLAWDAPVGYVPDHYEMSWWPAAAGVATIVNTKNTFASAELPAPGNYRFAIRAIDKNGTGSSYANLAWHIDQVEMSIHLNNGSVVASWIGSPDSIYDLECGSGSGVWQSLIAGITGNGPINITIDSAIHVPMSWLRVVSRSLTPEVVS